MPLASAIPPLSEFLEYVQAEPHPFPWDDERAGSQQGFIAFPKIVTEASWGPFSGLDPEGRNESDPPAPSPQNCRCPPRKNLTQGWKGQGLRKAGPGT